MDSMGFSIWFSTNQQVETRKQYAETLSGVYRDP